MPGQLQQLSRRGIGASEIAAIAGLNPFESPWDVWLRKTGQAPEKDSTSPMEWGNRLEPAIRQKYVDDTGSMIWVPPESMFHGELDWARATPDGIVLSSGVAKPERWQHLLQCKNVGTWVEKSWTEAPPAYVQLQEQWELFVTGLQRADVAALIGGNEFRVYTVHRDQKLIDDLVDIAAAFWRLVETKTSPPIDDSDACRDHFTKRIKATEAAELVADDRNEKLLAEWRELHAGAKASEKRIKTIKNMVLADLAAAGASRLVSLSNGAARLQKGRSGATSTSTDWKLVAELLGSLQSERFAALVAENTKTITTKDGAPVLYPPREWGKDSDG